MSPRWERDRAVACPALGIAPLTPEEAKLRLLQLIEDQPTLSQRGMAHALGLSLGKTNYCLRALMDAGLVKTRNFRSSSNKLAYAYRLTPKGVQERIGATVRLLERKSREYDALKTEIDRLKADLERLPGDTGAADR